MKKTLKAVLTVVVAVSLVLGSTLSLFAFNNGRTDDEIFSELWQESVLAACDNIFSELSGIFQNSAVANISLDTKGLSVDSNAQEKAREAIAQTGTDPEKLGEALIPLVDEYCSVYSRFGGTYVDGEILRCKDEINAIVARCIAVEYNSLKDGMNEQAIAEFKENFGEMTVYFDNHASEIVAAVPEEYVSMIGGNAEFLIFFVKNYFVTNKDTILSQMEELLKSDANINTKKVIIADYFHDILFDILRPVSQMLPVSMEELENPITEITSDYANVVCEQFQSYLASSVSSGNNTWIVSGAICLVVGLAAGFFIGGKKKKA